MVSWVEVQYAVQNLIFFLYWNILEQKPQHLSSSIDLTDMQPEKHNCSKAAISFSRIELTFPDFFDMCYDHLICINIYIIHIT